MTLLLPLLLLLLLGAAAAFVPSASPSQTPVGRYVPVGDLEVVEDNALLGFANQTAARLRSMRQKRFVIPDSVAGDPVKFSK